MSEKKHHDGNWLLVFPDGKQLARGCRNSRDLLTAQFGATLTDSSSTPLAGIRTHAASEVCCDWLLEGSIPDLPLLHAPQPAARRARGEVAGQMALARRCKGACAWTCRWEQW